MPINIPTMRPPPGAAMQLLEGYVGGQLPPSYVGFVREHDGARPEANSLRTTNNEVAVRRFIPVHEAVALAREIDGFPSGVIPLAEDDCGNYFYVEPKTGRVHFWDHEIEGPDEQLAPDVGSFVSKLSPLDAAKVTLATGQVARGWINPSFKPKF